MHGSSSSVRGSPRDSRPAQGNFRVIAPRGPREAGCWVNKRRTRYWARRRARNFICHAVDFAAAGQLAIRASCPRFVQSIVLAKSSTFVPFQFRRFLFLLVERGGLVSYIPSSKWYKYMFSVSFFFLPNVNLEIKYMFFLVRCYLCLVSNFSPASCAPQSEEPLSLASPCPSTVRRR